jgi:hypothetical protein
MKVTINITKGEAEHLKNCTSYHDACEDTVHVIEKILKAIR